MRHLAVLLLTFALLFVVAAGPQEEQHFFTDGQEVFPPKIARTKHGDAGQVIRVGGAAIQEPIGPRLFAGATGTYPASVDLTQYAPPVGNQGSLNSCFAWAIDYYQRGWYALRDGYAPPAPGSFAPMFTYSQTLYGPTNGDTYASEHYGILLSQGVDTRADYWQGDYDNVTLPTAAEKANATPYKIVSWSATEYSSDFASVIKAALSSGKPVVLFFPVFDDYGYASPTDYLVHAQTVPAPSWFYHANVAFAYDAVGVWVENQWGTGWGLNGWAELAWDFVSSGVMGVYTMEPVNPNSPAATATPTVAGTIKPTATITRTPKPTSTPKRRGLH